MANGATLFPSATDPFPITVELGTNCAVGGLDNADYIDSQSIVPASVTKDKPFPDGKLKMTFKNSGQTEWKSGSYTLVSLENGGGWKPQELALGHSICPGDSYSFAPVETAGPLIGSFPWQWQLRQGALSFFGEKSTLANIEINSSGSGEPSRCESSTCGGVSFCECQTIDIQGFEFFDYSVKVSGHILLSGYGPFASKNFCLLYDDGSSDACKDGYPYPCLGIAVDVDTTRFKSGALITAALAKNNDPNEPDADSCFPVVVPQNCPISCFAQLTRARFIPCNFELFVSGLPIVMNTGQPQIVSINFGIKDQFDEKPVALDRLVFDIEEWNGRADPGSRIVVLHSECNSGACAGSATWLADPLKLYLLNVTWAKATGADCISNFISSLPLCIPPSGPNPQYCYDIVDPGILEAGFSVDELTALAIVTASADSALAVTNLEFWRPDALGNVTADSCQGASCSFTWDLSGMLPGRFTATIVGKNGAQVVGARSILMTLN